MPMVDIDWLKDHVEVPDDLTYEQLAKDLVHVGLEEEEIHASQVTGPIVVGYVVDATPEPQHNGKIINWCHVDVGEAYNAIDEQGNNVPRGIVCGAPNMAAGEKVVVTLPGAVLPGDFRIEPRKTYGHVSDGMCASERELGLGDDHNGIILLRHYGFSPKEYEALKPGDDAMHLLHLDQPLLEINITPDRGYAFSYRGVAREYHHSTGAAYTDPVKELAAKAPVTAGLDPRSVTDIEVSIEDDNPIHGVAGCDRYHARVIKGFDPEAHTPNWMRRRLIRAGMRSISLAVDVTNYVMLDLGQPMHAYDLDKIEAPIVVRRARQDEHLVTLDGNDHALNPEDLLITDSPDGKRGSRVLGLAGVMGGLYGEVTAETKNVLLEAAHFDQVSIARSARRHKIPSEASRRFERGVDCKLQPAASQLASELLERYGNGEASQHPTDVNRTGRPKAIAFKASEVARVAGLDTETNTISDILTDIGCSMAGGGNGVFSVTPPTWRPDITEPCDLVEEVARLVGYDEIPSIVPPAPVEGAVGLDADQRHSRQVADELAEYGLVETLSYPFVGDEDFRNFSYDPSEIAKVSVEIANPLAADRPYLRRSLLLTLAQTVQRNLRRGIENIALYEIGHVYLWDPNAPAIPAFEGGKLPTDDQLAALDAGLPDQPKHVAGLLTGMAEQSDWMNAGRAVDWSDAVEAVQRIASRLGATIALEQLAAQDAPGQWHPGRVATVTSEGKAVGLVGELHPHVDEQLGLPEHSAAFELDLDALFATLDAKPVQARPISAFPPVRQDLAFTVPAALPAARLQNAIEQAVGDKLEGITLFDVFTGDQLGEGMKSLAFAVIFRAADRTLDSSDSEALRKAIIESTTPLGAQLRA
ncbi:MULTISPECIES: phenylalanine--tRNA ligase subunit beta [Bifidobacterium]|jgi:phenylalanyl-tRNA synthetase beta chain|uniref:Phenylalanine--tRNA ligase beta subunit n=1 Tax=Bifidobacterium tibiigranuli TaxID=2172043 RepID=A0A5N6RZ29_9BIFI|nr:phenylalanine--tRNA ligase subunit beta [Bifidobacterium tibiigranuli]KAE8126420.1 phenylalanine--tRNA ligase subunit beta [Bifidobacterium tibiigranuli]KAE8126513.1 phenylalanine--tRNA ligase subunit beta [Bifidobacterium tibiigranuli]MCI1212204.1 phenylalanine--tRNA ligase subunit beta [Bifidobacterium tibiigranuli]MCI1221315.1 phenylalanine--tRNA ligase subunit beta [Bifidobacterium tibiigranuli]MCI1232276.1 phenylalanine--tRNA ligase subunit beta [Bifidobacterium tibiigranuli]